MISAHLYKKMPYDALKDFTPIAMLASGPVRAGGESAEAAGASSVRELIALAKAQPGKIDYACSGNGSAQHLVGALFNSMAGIAAEPRAVQGQRPGDAGPGRAAR